MQGLAAQALSLPELTCILDQQILMHSQQLFVAAMWLGIITKAPNFPYMLYEVVGQDVSAVIQTAHARHVELRFMHHTCSSAWCTWCSDGLTTNVMLALER